MQQISYDPGIFGFIKAHRHPSGSALVMSRYEGEDYDVICVYWTKRLHHAAIPVHAHTFVIRNDKTILAAERIYDLLLADEPPDAAVCDYQRDQVYAWEGNLIWPYHPKLTWAGCRRFAAQVWRQVGTGQLVLTQERRFLDAISLDGVIHLPEQDRTGEVGFFRRKPVILHEIAHELTSGNQHGRRFVRTYLDLCERFLCYDRQWLERSMSEYQIDYE